LGRKRLWCIPRQYPGLRLDGLRKIKENLIQNNLIDVLARIKAGHHMNKIQN
jgi:hypothetical protein